MVPPRLELLYFDGCPSWQRAAEHLCEALKRLGLDWPMNLVAVRDDQHAAALCFLGSPSIRLNGQDLWSEERSDYGLVCRVYRTPEGLRGWPTVEMLVERLQERLGKTTG